ncbi:aminoacyl-tRNA hydrolase [Candidatus Saccharibacteria bacterium]|nr:MAG: aminoacyl-tRNA hydrolase [Candidatus Saccharibacteria bacterium]PID99540.1 MAG: aminoacyl-tRNA hydrolase [Candidatus Saccharibacteria bacterium]
MALFVKRPEIGSRLSFTTYGMNKTLLLVGLGNPGREYDGTRHNIGFACLDAFAAANDFEPWVNKTDMKCTLATKTVGDTRVILCKPQTFMNLSGEAVQAVLHFYKLNLEQVVVVYDDVAVDFGQVRLRRGGSSAGHNGIKNITKHLSSEDYGRVRVGVGPKKPEQIDSADFVLQTFSAKEQENIPKLLRETNATLSELAYGSPLTPDTRSFL